jgi:hypothetical protein
MTIDAMRRSGSSAAGNSPMRASMSRLLSDRVMPAECTAALPGSAAASATSSFQADEVSTLRNRPVACAGLRVGIFERFFAGTMARSYRLPTL